MFNTLRSISNKRFPWFGVAAAPSASFGLRRNNSLFAAIGGAASGWIGSLVSGMIYGAFIWALTRLLRKDFPLSRELPLLAASATFALFFFSSLLMNVVHFDGGANLFVLVQRAAFLALLPIASRLALSSRMEILEALEAGAFAGAFIAMAYGIWDLWSGLVRAHALSGNPGPFALAGVLVFTVNLNAALRRSDGGQRLHVFGAAFAAIAVFSSGMRTIWPILGLAALIVSRGQARLTRQQALAALLILGSAFALSWLAFGDMFQKRLLALIADYQAHGFSPAAETSLGQRMAMWTCAGEAIRAAPVFGLGDSAAQAFLKSCTQALVGTALPFSHFHNFALNAWVKGGVLDVVAVVAVLAAPVIASFGGANDEAGRSGKVILRTLSAAFIMAGSIGILFGHDIQDAIYMFFAIMGLHMISRKMPLKAKEQQVSASR